jgi:hypothetical protein
MFTFRNLAAVSMFLFGTTFMWLTPMFVAGEPKPKGYAWTLVSILSWVVMAGFTAGAWAIFKELSWWEPVATASAFVGIVTVVAYWLATTWTGEVVGAALNLVIHAAGIAGVFVATMFRPVNDWMTAHI